MNVRIPKIRTLWLGQHLLRFGIAGVFLWFGFSQLFDSLRWVVLVPEWAVNLVHLPPAMIVMGNGAFEVLMGTLIATNILVRLPAFILALHLLPIAYDFGTTATAIRDYGLVVASMSLALIYGAEEAQPEATQPTPTVAAEPLAGPQVGAFHEN